MVLTIASTFTAFEGSYELALLTFPDATCLISSSEVSQSRTLRQKKQDRSRVLR